MEEHPRSKLSVLLHQEIPLGRPFGRIRRALPNPLIPAVRRRWLARLLVVVVSIASATIFVWLHFIWTLIAIALPTFLGACERLRASGLKVTSGDWFCHVPSISTIVARASANSLVLASGYALACMILVAGGRRRTAFLPLIGAIGIFARGVPPYDRPSDLLIATLLLASPAFAMLLLGYPRRAPISAGPIAMLSAAFTCGVASYGADLLVSRILFHSWSSSLGAMSPGLFPYLNPLAIVLFGAMLGTGRKWWPWSLAVIAVLLSGGFTAALASPIEPRPILLVLFGATVPLFVAGLIWSGWQGLAERLARWRSSDRDKRPPVPDGRPVNRQLRPVVVLNAIAAAILVTSIMAFQQDPFTVWVAQPLPTFLGARDQANDVRTKLDLRQALTDMDAYYVKHGTYQGFDAALGTRIDPSLAWQDGLRSPSPKPGTPLTGASSPPGLTMALLTASGNQARLASLSNSGTAFCIQRVRPGLPTYGENRAGEVETAIKDCDSTPWTEKAVPSLPRLDCGNPASIICRMVEVLIHNIMRTTNPNSPWPPDGD